MERRGIKRPGVVMLLIVLVLFGLFTSVALYASRSHHSTATGTLALKRAPGTYAVVGNKIVAPNGAQFVPYGIVMECASLKVADVATLCTGNDRTGNPASAIIGAAASSWNANVIRFQLAQENLFSGPGGAVNPVYVNLVDSLVSQTNGAGMVAILTLQEENQSGYAYPTATSTAFWQYTAKHYKASKSVFFDLYNEPQLPASAFGSSGTTADVWNVWQMGGSALTVRTNSKGVAAPPKIDYVGMQSLVDTIRGQGAQNIVVAEGPNKDKDLSLVTSHELSGGNIAYGVEPNLTRNDRTPAQWEQNWGKYTRVLPIMPEAFIDWYGSFACDPKSPADVPNLLSYLKSVNLGLIFFSLDPNIGIIGTDLSLPTNYDPSSMADFNPAYCPSKNADVIVPNNRIGPGRDIQDYFKANSVRS